jgi:hypothetical protein
VSTTSPWSMKATAGGGGDRDNFVPPAGTQPAVLVAIIDNGTHREVYEDKEKGTSREVDVRKLALVWELPTRKISGYKDRNHVVAKGYTFSTGPNSKLRQLMETWRGKKYAEGENMDLGEILGQPFLLGLTHGTSAAGKKYARIETVAAVPEGMTVPPPLHTPFRWAIGDGPYPNPDWVPYLYGEPVRDIIARSMEGRAAKQAAGGNDGEEIPF